MWDFKFASDATNTRQYLVFWPYEKKYKAFHGKVCREEKRFSKFSLTKVDQYSALQYLRSIIHKDGEIEENVNYRI